MDLSSLLQTVLSGVTQSNQRLDAEAQALQQDTARMQELMTVNAQQGQQVAQMSADALAQKIAIDFTRNKTKEDAQRLIGFDRDQQDNQFARSVAELDAAQTERAAVRKEYDQISNMDFMSNPIGYIVGQLKMPSVAARHNNLVDREAAAEQNIATRAAMLQNYNSTTVANTAADIAKMQQLDARAQAEAAQIKLREAEMQNLSTLASQRMRQVQIADKQQDNLSKAVSMQMQAAQFQMSMEERQEARAERRALAEERMKDKKLRTEQESLYNEGLARVSVLAGLPIKMDLTTLKQLPDTKAKQKWLEAAATNTLGDNLGDSLQFFNGIMNRQTLAQQNPTLLVSTQKMQEAIGSYATTIANTRDKTTLKAPSAKEAALQAPKQYEDDIVRAASDPKATRTLTDKYWDTMFNPYKADHAVMIDKSAGGVLPELKNNVLVKNLQTIAAATPDGRITGELEQQAIKAVAAQVRQGQITPKEAAGQISQYYKTAVAVNRELYQYELFNLPAQSKYRITVAKPGFTALGATEPLSFDSTNPAQVETALTKLAASNTSRMGHIDALLGIPANKSPSK